MVRIDDLRYLNIVIACDDVPLGISSTLADLSNCYLVQSCQGRIVGANKTVAGAVYIHKMAVVM